MKKIISAFLAILIIVSSFGQQKNLFKIVENGKIGYMSEKGKIVIEPKYKNGYDFSENLAAVRLNGKYGFIDSNGIFVIQPKYDFAREFYHGIACVYISDKAFFINKQGQIVLDTLYTPIDFIDANKVIIKTTSDKMGILDIITKKLVADTIYNTIDFSNDIAVVSITKKGADGDIKFEYAIMNSMGKYIVPFGEYAEIRKFTEGVAKVIIKDKISKYGYIDGAIDKNCKLLFQRPIKNQSLIPEDFHDGLAIVNLNKYWTGKPAYYNPEAYYQGYINLKGEVVFNDPAIMYLKDFSNGRAFIKDAKKKYRLINTKFQKIGAETYDDVQGDKFDHGYAIVKKDDKCGIIDTNGKYLVGPRFKDIDYAGIIDNYFFYEASINEDQTLFGIATVSGEIITEPILQDFDRSGFINGLLKTIISNKLTYIDKNGNIIWQQKDAPLNELYSFDIDYMNRGYFRAFSTPDTNNTYGGFAVSRNIPRLISNEEFPKNNLSIIVNTQKPDTTYKTYKSYQVTISNLTDSRILFNAQDSRLYMITQAKDINDEWKDIEYLPRSWCGNSYHLLKLEKEYYWTFSTPAYSGEYKTKLRIKLQYIDPTDKSDSYRRGEKEIIIYSNEYDGSVNPGQFWNKMQYSPRGIMDPYID